MQKLQKSKTKTPNNSYLDTTAGLNKKATEIKNKIANTDIFITTPEIDKLARKIFDKKIKLVTKDLTILFSIILTKVHYTHKH